MIWTRIRVKKSGKTSISCFLTLFSGQLATGSNIQHTSHPTYMNSYTVKRLFWRGYIFRGFRDFLKFCEIQTREELPNSIVIVEKRANRYYWTPRNILRRPSRKLGPREKYPFYSIWNIVIHERSLTDVTTHPSGRYRDASESNNIRVGLIRA